MERPSGVPWYGQAEAGQWHESLTPQAGGHGAGGRHQASPHHAAVSLGATQQWKQQTRVRARSATSRAGLSHPGHQMSPVWANQSCRLPTLDLRTGKVTRKLCSVWLWGGGNSCASLSNPVQRLPRRPAPGPDLPLCSFSAFQFATSRPWSCLACSPSSCWSTRW